MIANGAMNPAIMSATLTGIMNAGEFGVVPIEIVAGKNLHYNVIGYDRRRPEPLVQSSHVNIDVDSILGYRESAVGRTVAPSVSVQRDWLEVNDFFKQWSVLQSAANRVAGLVGDDAEEAIRYGSNDFELALLNQALDSHVGAVGARKLYEDVAIKYEADRNFTAAAMVWERAATNLDREKPEKFEKIHRGRAARAWYRSLPLQRVDYDPTALRFSRGIWNAYGNDEQFHRMLLMRQAKFKERRGQKHDAGGDRLRLAFSILSGEMMSKSSWSNVSTVLVSAAELLEGIDGIAINIGMLLELAQEAKKQAES